MSARPSPLQSAGAGASKGTLTGLTAEANAPERATAARVAETRANESAERGFMAGSFTGEHISVAFVATQPRPSHIAGQRAAADAGRALNPSSDAGYGEWRGRPGRR